MMRWPSISSTRRSRAPSWPGGARHRGSRLSMECIGSGMTSRNHGLERACIRRHEFWARRSAHPSHASSIPEKNRGKLRFSRRAAGLPKPCIIFSRLPRQPPELSRTPDNGPSAVAVAEQTLGVAVHARPTDRHCRRNAQPGNRRSRGSPGRCEEGGGAEQLLAPSWPAAGQAVS